MSRSIRYIPAGGALVEVTMRTLQGRFLLRPSRRVNDIVVGVFARAQRRYGVETCGIAVLTNHYHALLYVETAQQLARFMNFVNSNLAKKIGRLHGWRQKFWGNRYTAVLVSEEETAQMGRLRYLLSQSVKEDLVEDPRDWPGIHCAQALGTSGSMEGFWFDQTRRSAAKRRGKKPDAYAHGSRETLQLTPLPCWKALPEDAVRQQVRDLISGLITEHRRRRARSRSRVLGRRGALRQHPHRRSRRAPARRPAPRVHAASREIRRRIVRAYGAFVARYREAAERLRYGEKDVAFPAGAFPPPAPFVAPS